MRKPHPEEFRRGVVGVARKHSAALSRFARDFGISQATLRNWLRKAEVDDSVRPGVTTAAAEELRLLCDTSGAELP